jgi:hypothetical protein
LYLVVKEQNIITNYMRKQEIPFMQLTKNGLKSLIKEALGTQKNEAAVAPIGNLGGGLLGAGAAAGAADAADENTIAVQNLFLAAFGLKPQQGSSVPQQVPSAASQQGQADGSGSWTGKSWRDVMSALKSEFNIQGSKGWYKKLPYTHEARVKYREWYTSRGK